MFHLKPQSGQNFGVPYDYVLEGTTSSYKRTGCGVYTYHGESVPYTDCEMLDEGILNWLKLAMKAEGYGLGRFMRFGYARMEWILCSA